MEPTMHEGVVIPVGDFSVEKKRRGRLDADVCNHLHMQMSDDGHTVFCTDCKKQLSAYYVLEIMMDSLVEQRELADRLTKKATEERNAVCHLRAAKHFESLWREKDSLPCCPHCKEGITPEDALKASRCSKSLYIQKIKNKVSN